MSVLPVMEKLLEGVEVEWKAIRDIARYSGDRVASNQLDAESYVGVESLLQNKMGKTQSSSVPSEGFSTGYKKGDVLIGNIRPYLKKIWLADRNGGTNGDVLVIRVLDEKVSPEYLYQVLGDDKFFSFNMQHAKGAKMPRGDKNKIMDYQIPIPPLNVQAEIVRILDAFTAYTAELTAELTARKKQYNHYRDQLLSFNETEVEWKTLGEITSVFSSSRVHKNEWTDSGVRFFRTSDVISIFNGVNNSRADAFISEELYEKLSSKSGKLEAGDVLVTGGGTIGIPYVVPNDEPLYFKDADLLCIKRVNCLNSYFLYHFFLTTNFRDYLKSISHNSTIGHYTIAQIKKTPVPVPSIEEQARIVAILDKFDALTTSITEGLPREIELRQKQYEYYRDRLLSFPKPASDAAA